MPGILRDERLGMKIEVRTFCLLLGLEHCPREPRKGFGIRPGSVIRSTVLEAATPLATSMPELSSHPCEQLSKGWEGLRPRCFHSFHWPGRNAPEEFPSQSLFT